MTKTSTDVCVIGAGPAGLSAAFILSENHKDAVVLEMSGQVGGISRTIVRDGFRFDLGGHRFFTKDDEIDDFFRQILGDEAIWVPRSSKIFYMDKYFDYPLTPANALMGMGIGTTARCLGDYGLVKIRNLFRKPEIVSLEDWVSNEFGRELFKLFFKNYTEKVWGIDCDRICAEWAAQRIKGLSLRVAVRDALFPQKDGKVATLIDKFMYPRLGIGRISERLVEDIEARGNEVRTRSRAAAVNHEGGRITSVDVESADEGNYRLEVESLCSSMPLTELVLAMRPQASEDVRHAAGSLRYRDLITVNLMVDKPQVTDQTWIYIHDPTITLGRVHEPKNWSVDMAPEGKSSIVAEYFCFEGDSIWTMDDRELIDLTIADLDRRLGFLKKEEVIDGFVVRVPKAYPMYELGYEEPLKKVMDYVGGFSNLEIVGRYGTYKYNNMDHSMKTGILAARNLLGESHDIHEVNLKKEYHEEKVLEQ
ncbi:MAG: NAD(P)/FAD-dependent oxidoreductase [Thermoleophilia bacterium]|nr:NAD(P)/FAD-dependent oxidoreductase [Thermoleophilia bacterium]